MNIYIYIDIQLFLRQVAGGTESTMVRMSPCVKIVHKDIKNTIPVHFVTVMNHVIGLKGDNLARWY